MALFEVRSMAHNDQDALSVIQAVIRDLRHNGQFCELLEKLNDQEARLLAEQFISFLYETLKLERGDE
jgi:hypothetical protein